MTPEQRRELTEFEKLSPLQQRQALHRRDVVCLWTVAKTLAGTMLDQDDAAASQTALHVLATFKVTACEATVRGWDRAFRHDGVVGLADQRRLPRGRLRQYGPFFAELERVYTGPGLHSIEMCHELSVWEAKAKSWSIPTLRDSHRFLKKYILPGLTAERKGQFEGGVNRASNDI
jgi:hypothetical protein